MKKEFICFIAVIFLAMIIPSALAVNLNVEKLSSNEAYVTDINRPIEFDLRITNLGASDSFQFYNLLGFEMFPVGTTYIGTGESKTVNLTLSPIGNLDARGHYTLDYFIKGSDGSVQKESLTFEIVDLKNAFEVGSGNIETQTGNVEIYISNKENFDFGAMSARFSSAFFDFQKNFTLGPYDKKTFSVQLNKEDFKQLMAGFYTLNVEINTQGKTADVEGTIKFVEKDAVTTTSDNSGFIINTNIIKKVNDGNTIAETETVVKKNIISRLFTTITPEPDNVDRQGFTVYYTWNRELKPGEALEVDVKTNWLFPILVVALIIAIVLLAKQYSKTNVVLKKKVSFVKAKGGEFALKVSIMVNARKYVERVNVIDRLPPLVKIYDRFGGEKPTRVDEKTKRLEWNFDKLEPGETRVLSYIIYSKVGVLGKFALPTASAIYEKDGEISETESNRAFFITEQRTKDLED